MEQLIANQYDGINVDHVFHYVPEFVPGGKGDLWELHRVEKWTFSPTVSDRARLTFAVPKDGKLVLPPVLVDPLEEDDVEIAIYQNGTLVFGPVTAKKEERHGISTLLFEVSAGDRLVFEMKTLGRDTTADWPISLYYDASWVKEETLFQPDDAEELSRSGFFAGLVKDVKMPCPFYQPSFDDVTEEDPCYNAVYELRERGLIPPQMVQDNCIFPKQSINGYEAVSVLVRLWESFRRPIQGAETILQKAEKLGLPYFNGALSPKQVKELFNAFAEARKAPVGRTVHGEYSPVYKGVIREDLDIQQLIEEAYFSGASEVTIPEGIYRLWPVDPEKSRVEQAGVFYPGNTMCPHLCLNGFKNFTVHGYGVTLLFQERRGAGIFAKTAENLSFEGLTLDYETPVFTQAELTAVNLEEQYIDFEIEQGYDCDFGDERFGNTVGGSFFTADRELSKTASSFAYPKSMLSHLGENRYRLTHPNLIGLTAGLAPGDYVCFRGEKIANTFFFEETDGIRVTDCTVYTGNVGISVSGGDETNASYYTRYKDVPGPAVLGTLTPRMNATSGTGFHITGLRHGFEATDCYIRNNGDDGTNIHGTHARLCEDLGDSTYIIAQHTPRGKFKPGDPLRIYDGAYGLLDEATVVRAEELTDYTPPEGVETVIGIWTFTCRKVFRIKTDHPLRCEQFGWVINGSELSGDFKIKRCSFIGSKSRGMLIKAGGIVEDCCVRRCVKGIMAAPEIFWLEPDHVFGLTVKNTTVSECGFGRHPSLSYGATTHAYATTKNRDILFEHCTFADNYRIQLHANKVQNMTVRDCTFKEAPCAYAHITVDNGENVVLENNGFAGDLPVYQEESADARFWSMYKKGRWE